MAVTSRSPGTGRTLEEEVAMAFVVGVLLFVVVAGILDARLLRWPDPRREAGR